MRYLYVIFIIVVLLGCSDEKVETTQLPLPDGWTPEDVAKIKAYWRGKKDWLRETAFLVTDGYSLKKERTYNLIKVYYSGINNEDNSVYREYVWYVQYCSDVVFQDESRRGALYYNVPTLLTMKKRIKPHLATWGAVSISLEKFDENGVCPEGLAVD